MDIRFKPFVKSSFEQALATVRGAIDFTKFLAVPTPQELLAVYSRGFRGINKDNETFEEKQKYADFQATMPSLYEIFPWAKGLGKGKIVAPYLACALLISGWGGLFAQVQGDCTVHGNEHAAELDYCNDCIFGEAAFKGPIAFENVYRSRGFNGDGWSCYAPAYYVGPEGKGGFLYRKVYEGPNGEKVDLTKYNSSWQSNGRAGVPSWLEEESRKNKAKWIIRITTMEEYRDALALGFGINVCSGQGFASSTDQYGLAEARGGWSHAMASTACNDTEWAHKQYGDMTGCVQNSWGRTWNKINGKPDGGPALAPGSFWARSRTLSSMLRGGDSYAICGVWGWDRTSWEAFDITSMKEHLRSSTVQDYYKHRSEGLMEFTTEVVDSDFLAI